MPERIRAAGEARYDREVATYQTQVTLDTPPPLPLGATVPLAIPVAQRDNVLVVPNRALHRSGGEATVSLVGKEGVTIRPVTVGLGNSQVSEITSGLEAGDVVLLDDAQRSSAQQ